MELRQRQVLKHLLVPGLTQSLKILSLSYLELKEALDEALNTNPLLEENAPQGKPEALAPSSPPSFLKHKPPSRLANPDWEFRPELISRKNTLRDILSRQLAISVNTPEELRIGEELVDYIDDNGYLKADLSELASRLGAPLTQLEAALRCIQRCEPAGIGARDLKECLMLQLEANGEKDPLIRQIVSDYLEEVAKKNYNKIAKELQVSSAEIEPRIKKILKLDPKPGRNYSTDEPVQVIPDIFISDDGEEFSITIYEEELPRISLNREYRVLLKKNGLAPEAKAGLDEKLRQAQELIRAVVLRHQTLRRIVEAVVEVQKDAIRDDLSQLKPLTFRMIAERLNLHETTVCRAVMNKYVQLPDCIMALRDFFPSRSCERSGEAISEVLIKSRIKELVHNEDKHHPLSDQELSGLLLQEGLAVSRRTITKYREELKLLCSTYRKQY